ncbi:MULTISPECIES: uroporphyrinogen decarboxylase family protein [Eubacteriales]|uniref:uroporphyrinogen decarboxylase family protein n=1 Tax=Eubacteriales TaxID=186802 RepID=UPI0005545854|nr:MULTISPECIES: uroporphyrinogen decarboxylase family protein [Eubacteriales]
MAWTKRDRFRAVMNGELADRVPVTAYRHHTEFEHSGPRVMADKLLEFQREYDWDVMKINPRAVYYYEAWGNEYDYDHYNDVVPTRTKTLIHDYRDLEKVSVLPGDQGVFAEQLDMCRMIVQDSGGEVPIIQSAFTPIGILLNLCGMRSVGRYRPSPREESPLIDLCLDHPDEVKRALKNIAETMADYCSKLLTTGIDGVFYACLGMARSGYFTLEEWKEFVEPYDLMVLEALKGSQVIIHTCGIYGNPERFTSWPINMIHWASSAVGCPPIWGSKAWLNGKIAMGGVDERPFGQNKAEEIGRLARTTLQKMQDEPFLLAPDCSVSVHTQDDELRAFRASVEETLR